MAKMKIIEIVLSEKEIKELAELTDVEIDTEEPDDEDVSYAISVLIKNS